jgi:hypothetical protein
MPDNEGFLGGGTQDLVNTVKGIAQNLGLLVQVFSTAFPRINGTFTLSAATTTNVAEVRVAGNAVVFWSPTNATAALIERTNGLFHATSTSGVGFTLSTQSGSASAGGTFEYVAVNPS